MTRKGQERLLLPPHSLELLRASTHFGLEKEAQGRRRVNHSPVTRPSTRSLPPCLGGIIPAGPSDGGCTDVWRGQPRVGCLTPRSAPIIGRAGALGLRF